MASSNTGKIFGKPRTRFSKFFAFPSIQCPHRPLCLPHILWRNLSVYSFYYKHSNIYIISAQIQWQKLIMKLFISKSALQFLIEFTLEINILFICFPFAIIDCCLFTSIFGEFTDVYVCVCKTCKYYGNLLNNF